MVNVNGNIIYCNLTVMLYCDCTSNISNHKVTRQLQMYFNCNVTFNLLPLTNSFMLTGLVVLICVLVD